MRTNLFSHRTLTALQCLSLIFGLCGPIDFTPSAEAASPAAVKRLKKKNKKLKKRLRMALAAANGSANPATPPIPPTPGMKLIPAGTFMMGDETNGSEGDNDELPLHSVSLSAFYLDQFEVTKALWEKVKIFADANGYTFENSGSGQGAFHPVHTVNWYDVVKWCNARSEMEELTPVYYTDATQTTVYRTGAIDLQESFVKWAANGYRLPTEAEFEYAARGGVPNKAYPWGEDTIGQGDANSTNSGDPFDTGGTETTPVGFYDGGQVPSGVDRGNGFGLYDMAGNMNEWCWDRYNDAYLSSPATNPRGPSTGFVPFERVIRGGAWISSNTNLRCAARDFAQAMNEFTFYGFRTVRGR